MSEGSQIMNSLIYTVLGCNLCKDPVEALMNKPINIPHRTANLITFIFNATKQTVACSRKSLMLHFLEVISWRNWPINEKLLAFSSDTHNKCLNIWSTCISYSQPHQVFELWGCQMSLGGGIVFLAPFPLPLLPSLPLPLPHYPPPLFLYSFPLLLFLSSFISFLKL